MQTEWLNSLSNENYSSKLNEFLIPSTTTTTSLSNESLSSPEGDNQSSSNSSPSNSSNLQETTNNNSNNTITTTISPHNLMNKRPISSNDDILTLGSIKDIRRSSSNSSNINNKEITDDSISEDNQNSSHSNNGIHSHPTFEHDDNHHGGDVGEEEEDNKDGLKGPKTSDKRKAQNRQAQRAFRERKEQHLKELEDRVFTLEKADKLKQDENGQLKELLNRLQSENERLKVFESAFEFTYTKDVSNSTSMSLAPQFGIDSFPSPTSTNTNAIASSSISNFPSSTSTTTTDYSQFDLSASAFGLSPSSTYNSYLNNNASTSSTTSPLASTSTAQQPNIDEFFYNPLTSLPSPTSTLTSNTSNSNPLTPPDTTSTSLSLSNDLFLNYRDLNSQFDLISDSNSTGITTMKPIDEFEALFGNLSGSILNTTTLPSLSPSSSNNNNIDEEILDLSSYITSPSPQPQPTASTSLVDSTMGEKIPMINPTETARNLIYHGNPNCPIVQAARAVAGWSSTGGAGSVVGEVAGVNIKNEYDIDGLCSDMKAKATCQEAARIALQEAMQEDAKTSLRLFPSI